VATRSASGRPQLKPGEIGDVEVHQVGERFTARACTRDGGGRIRRPRHTADTEEAAVEGLRQKARKMAFLSDAVGPTTPLEYFLDRWLEESARYVKPQTMRSYTRVAVWMKGIAGAIEIGELDVQRVRKLLDDVAASRSKAAARQARVALAGAFDAAIVERALTVTPLAFMPRPRQAAALPKALDLEQIALLRHAIAVREDATRTYSGRQAALLRWVVELQLATGLRIGEVLALRHMDVNLAEGYLLVTGTLIDDENNRVVRQDELKGREQARRIEFPLDGIVARILSEARAACSSVQSRQPEAPAIQSRSGTWVSPRNIRRALRSLRNDPDLVHELKRTKLAPSDLTPHIFRRTAATLLAQAMGNLAGAQTLLGHSDSRTTRNSYAGVAYRAVGDAALLDTLLGGGEVVTLPGVASGT